MAAEYTIKFYKARHGDAPVPDIAAQADLHKVEATAAEQLLVHANDSRIPVYRRPHQADIVTGEGKTVRRLSVNGFGKVKAVKV